MPFTTIRTLAATTGIMMMLAMPATGFAASLLFSEYVEGSSFNKALEIYNGGTSSLDALQIDIYANGNLLPSASISIATPIPPGGVYVIASSRAGGTLTALADQLSSLLNFNGDDAITLSRNGSVLDAIGQIGFDPGTEWGAGMLSTLNHTLRRRLDVLTPDTNPFDDFQPNLDVLGGDWDGFGIDDYSDLGRVAPPIVPLPPAVWLFASGIAWLGWVRKRTVARP